MFNSSHGGRYIILYVPFMLHDYFRSFAFVLWIHKCVYDVSDRSITVWRHCWAVRIMRAAPHSTTPADWVSMTRWRTCWASLGRTASLASPRTRSLSCILLLSEFNGSPKAWLSVPSDWTIPISVDCHSSLLSLSPIWSKQCQQSVWLCYSGASSL